MRRTAIKKVSDKQRALKARELQVKIQIIRAAKGRCEACGTQGHYDLYPLTVHHKGIGTGREELRQLEDGTFNGELLCMSCHAKRHGIEIKKSKPQWSMEK